jgi:hypothetical protein
MYLTFDKNSIVKLGDVFVIGNVTKDINVEVALPRQPKAVTINAMHDVLAR